MKGKPKKEIGEARERERMVEVGRKEVRKGLRGKTTKLGNVNPQLRSNNEKIKVRGSGGGGRPG